MVGIGERDSRKSMHFLLTILSNWQLNPFVLTSSSGIINNHQEGQNYRPSIFYPLCKSYQQQAETRDYAAIWEEGRETLECRQEEEKQRANVIRAGETPLIRTIICLLTLC